MAWALERDAAQLDAVLDLDPDLRPGLVSVSFGGVDPFVARLREAGVRVAVQAGTVAEAERAAAAGADLVVARGGEAGGTAATRWRRCRCCRRCWTASTCRWWRRAAWPGRAGWPRCSPPARSAPGSGRRCWPRTRPARRRPRGSGCSRRTAPTRRTAGSSTSPSGSAGPRSSAAGRCATPSSTAGRDRLDELAVPTTRPPRSWPGHGGDGDLDAAYVYAGQGAALLTEERRVADVLADLGRRRGPAAAVV